MAKEIEVICENTDCPDHNITSKGNCNWRLGKYDECCDFEGDVVAQDAGCKCGLPFQDPAVVVIGKRWMCAACIGKMIDSIQDTLKDVANQIEDRAAEINRAADDKLTVELMDSWVKRIRGINQPKETNGTT